MLVEREIRDYKMVLDTEDIGMSTQLMQGMRWEGYAPDILDRIIQPGWVCLELGACLGFYMLLEAKAGARVYAVEPDPHNIEIMRKAAEVNGFTDAEVRIYEAAIGGENGVKKFRPSKGRSDRGRLAGSSSADDGIDVKVLTLDGFCARVKLGEVNLLRCDIEGSEVAMVREGQRTISSMPKGSWIFADLHPVLFPRPYKEIGETVRNLLGHGFKPQYMLGHDFKPTFDVKRATTDEFIRACCRPTFPRVFFEKH